MVGRKPTDAKGTAERGREIAHEELMQRGAKSISEKHELNRRVLRFVNGSGEKLRLIVKSRTSGTWQGTIKDGNPAKIDERTFWLFVDLSVPHTEYFIVPDAWMRKDIEMVHSQCLHRAGGQRVNNPDSDHHAIDRPRIEQWRARWDLIGLSVQTDSAAGV